MSKNIDWAEIQTFYDENHTWREITEKFGVTPSTINKAAKSGKFKTRSSSEGLKMSLKLKPRIQTQETKDKISKSMLLYLEANPQMVGFVKNHWTKRKSWAEKQLETALLKNALDNFEFNYQNGIYCYDFAWLDIKLDVEVDGNTHTDIKVKEKDIRRDSWSISQGWEVLRFTWRDIRYDLTGTVEIIKAKIEEMKQFKH